MRILFESALTINQEIKKLIDKEALNSFGTTNYQGDNANYCISLFQDYLINPNELNKNFLFYMGQSLIKWTDKKFHNGYFRMEDVHHGTEVFLGFLPRYIDLFPEEQKPKELIIKLANYIGNWNKKTDSWYNYSKKNFNSWSLGSEGCDKNPAYRFNTADHLRFVHIALLAWQISGDDKYLDWSIEYSREFAKKIIQTKSEIPVAWDNDWKEYFHQDMISPEEKWLSASQHHFDSDPISGVENLVASGSIFIFGNLYKLTQDEIFFKASKKIINILIHMIVSPQSDSIGALVSYYRNTFSDYSFDEIIINYLKKIPTYNESEMMLGFPENQKIRKQGVGNRRDMVYWFHFDFLKSNEFKEPPTSFFSLAYNITGELKYVERAFKTAARKIKIASSLLRTGFEHSDSGKLFSSVISGHGRNWGVGSVTGCYSKLIIGSYENLGACDYIIKFLSPTLNRGCLPLIRDISGQTSELLVYNFSNKKNSLKFVNKKDDSEGLLEIQPNSTSKTILKN